MAWEIVASALGASGIPAIAALGNAWLANQRATDDYQRDIGRDAIRLRSQLRREECQNIKQTIG